MILIKCLNCPLCISDNTFAYCGDEDVICLVSKNYEIPEFVDFDNGGCKRTNKFILSQNPEELIRKMYEKVSKELEKYIEEMENIK